MRVLYQILLAFWEIGWPKDWDLVYCAWVYNRIQDAQSYIEKVQRKLKDHKVKCTASLDHIRDMGGMEAVAQHSKDSVHQIVEAIEWYIKLFFGVHFAGNFGLRA